MPINDVTLCKIDVGCSAYMYGFASACKLLQSDLTDFGDPASVTLNDLIF